MQIVVITGPTYEIAKSRIALAKGLDGVEFRLDLFHSLSIEEVAELRKLAPGKVIFTLRNRRQGGSFKGVETARLALIEKLLSLSPDYFDLEYDIDPLFLQTITQAYPQTKIILSQHDFEKTPKNLSLTLKKMISTPADIYKLCTTANSLSDSYRMLRFVQITVKQGISFIGLCMGDQGRLTRTEGVKSGNYLNYNVLGREAGKPSWQPSFRMLRKNRPIECTHEFIHGFF